MVIIESIAKKVGIFIKWNTFFKLAALKGIGSKMHFTNVLFFMVNPCEKE